MPNTVPHPPVGSDKEHPDKEAVKDPSEAVPKNESKEAVTKKPLLATSINVHVPSHYEAEKKEKQQKKQMEEFDKTLKEHQEQMKKIEEAGKKKIDEANKKVSDAE